MSAKGEHHDIYFGHGEEGSSLWQSIEQSAKKMGYQSTSEFIRSAMKKEVAKVLKKVLPAEKTMKTDFDNVEISESATTMRIKVNNVSDKKRVKVDLSFYTRSKEKKVTKVISTFDRMRDGKKFVQPQPSKPKEGDHAKVVKRTSKKKE